MPRIKNKTLVYAAAIVLFLISISISYIGSLWKHSSREYVQFGVGIFSALLATVQLFIQHIPSAKKLKFKLQRKLGLHDDPAVVTDINREQLENVKAYLLFKVGQYAKQVLDNIEKSTPIIAMGNIIKTKQVIYDDFKDFTNGEKSIFKDERGIPRHFHFAITGSPGGGKTFTLFKQIESKIARITGEMKNNDFKSQIPVYLSLNSWKSHSGFEEWLKERIPREYRCSPGNITTLLARSEIIPFVDGLDEVASEDRSECFKALLEYAQSQSVVFSCRKENLLALLAEIDILQENNIRVWELEPLSRTIIINTINNTQKNSSEIFRFLNSKHSLFEFLISPLRLNLFLTVFDSLSDEMKEEIKKMDDAQVEIFLWEKYDELMLEEKYGKDQEKARKWPVKNIRTYMVWLAKKMSAQTFFIEDLQPSWLQKPHRIRLYYFTSRIISGFILAIGVGLFLAGPVDFIGNGIFATIFVILMTFFLNRFKKGQYHTYWAMIFLFTLTLVIVTFLYQGFAVPRLPEDMYTDNFSLTESFAGFLLGLFFGVVFGYRKSKQNAQVDVRPVEQYKERFLFNWKKALKTGVIGGCCIGFFLGISAIVIHTSFYGNTFDKWLEENVGRFMGFTSHLIPGLPSISIYVQMALFGFLAGFFIGFIIFALMGGRDQTTIVDIGSEGKKSKNRLNSGMILSLTYSFKYGIIVMLVVGISYGAFIYWLTGIPGSLVRAAFIGLGTGIISLLWFGGFEVIQHWTLRSYLYIYGITPFRYSKWVKIAEDSALMRRVGPSLQFYHPNLQKYYSEIPLNDDRKRIINLQRKKWLAPLYFIGVPLILFLIAYPFILKSNKAYWQNPDQTTFVNLVPQLYPAASNTFFAAKEGVLHLKISGGMKVGTFTGTVNVSGTETGLLGFPISDVYDLEAHCRHGALIYQIERDGIKSGWAHVSERKMYLRETVVANILLQENDSIRFKINDKEWQNNRGCFRIVMTMSDSSVNNK